MCWSSDSVTIVLSYVCQCSSSYIICVELWVHYMHTLLSATLEYEAHSCAMSMLSIPRITVMMKRNMNNSPNRSSLSILQCMCVFVCEERNCAQHQNFCASVRIRCPPMTRENKQGNSISIWLFAYVLNSCGLRRVQTSFSLCMCIFVYACSRACMWGNLRWRVDLKHGAN
jgi:hypothetical protein